jgi:dipeptide/tripeptide permease
MSIFLGAVLRLLGAFVIVMGAISHTGQDVMIGCLIIIIGYLEAMESSK